MLFGATNLIVKVVCLPTRRVAVHLVDLLIKVFVKRQSLLYEISVKLGALLFQQLRSVNLLEHLLQTTFVLFHLMLVPLFVLHGHQLEGVLLLFGEFGPSLGDCLDYLTSLKMRIPLLDQRSKLLTVEDVG